MKRIIVAFVFALLVIVPPLGAEEIRLDGEFIQGGLVRGNAPLGTAVTLDGRALQVSPKGHFVFGFGRDAAPKAELVLTHASGAEETRILNIMSRQYDIQRIEGLPKKMVTPPPETLDRIRAEGAKVRAARAFDTPETYFAAPFCVAGARADFGRLWQPADIERRAAPAPLWR